MSIAVSGLLFGTHKMKSKSSWLAALLVSRSSQVKNRRCFKAVTHLSHLRQTGKTVGSEIIRLDDMIVFTAHHSVKSNYFFFSYSNPRSILDTNSQVTT